MVKQTLTRRVVLALALVVALASGALAQDFIYTRFQTHVTYALPEDPCGPVGVSHLAPLVYDTSAWLFYQCNDGKGYARRFLHPNDKDQFTRIVPVRIVEDMPPAYNMPLPTPTYDTTNPNWNGTGMTEAQWRARYPVR
jgi:hypothetical protein